MMNRGSGTIKINCNPLNSITIKCATKGNTMLAVDEISKLLLKDKSINMYDIPVWVVTLEALASALKSQMSKDQIETYEMMKAHLNVTTVAINPFGKGEQNE